VHLPGCLSIALLCFLPLLAPNLVERCIGHPLAAPNGKGAAAIHSALATLCSPLLITGPGHEPLLAAAIIALIIASLWARRWIKQHQAHWDIIRAQERAHRAEKRRQKQAATPPET